MEEMMATETAFSSAKQILRRGAFAAVVAATSLAAMNAIVAPAYAQRATQVSASTVPPVGPNTDCNKWQPGLLFGSHECEVLKGQALGAQGGALDIKLAELAREQRCTDFLKTGIKTGSLDKEAVRTAYNGRPVPQVPACEIAGKFGYNPS